jgi:hypothetical protein
MEERNERRNLTLRNDAECIRSEPVSSLWDRWRSHALRNHLDTGVLLVPMDQRSVIRHLKLWGFSDTPASDGVPGVEVINPMLCEMQTRRYVRKADEINRFGPDDLLDRAYELAFDENTPPPPDELCMNLGEYPIAARGNLTCVQGKSKVGKSAVIAAILGACQRGQYACTGDTLCFEWEGRDGGAIIHLDTEQSSGDRHALVRRFVRRSELPSVPDRLISIPPVRFARSERLTILELVLAKEKRSAAASTRWSSTEWPTCALHPMTRPSRWN